MKVYICAINSIVDEHGYTSLLGACELLGVSYDSASKGKRVWAKPGEIKTIQEINIVKIKNRGRK